MFNENFCSPLTFSELIPLILSLFTIHLDLRVNVQIFEYFKELELVANVCIFTQSY